MFTWIASLIAAGEIVRPPLKELFPDSVNTALSDPYRIPPEPEIGPASVMAPCWLKNRFKSVARLIGPEIVVGLRNVELMNAPVPMNCNVEAGSIVKTVAAVEIWFRVSPLIAHVGWLASTNDVSAAVLDP